MLELLIAVVFETIKSEPPERIHPTVWFGKIIELLDRKLPAGIIAGVIPVLLTSAFAFILAEISLMMPYPFSVFLSGYLLYSAISIKSMTEHANNCIKGGKVVVDEVRKIVGRDLENLEKWKLNSAIIESVAENFIDGVMAPLFYYSIFGIHGALIYRAVNTCDAMLGYRKGRYEKFGKVSAKLDDLANFIPSRLSLLLYLILSRRALICGLKKNPKLNGHSISAMGGLLGIRLEKSGHYVIDCGKEPQIQDVVRAVKYFKVLSGMAVILTLSAKLLV